MSKKLLQDVRDKPSTSLYRGFQNVGGEHSVAGVPASLYNLSQKCPRSLVQDVSSYQQLKQSIKLKCVKGFLIVFLSFTWHVNNSDLSSLGWKTYIPITNKPFVCDHVNHLRRHFSSDRNEIWQVDPDQVKECFGINQALIITSISISVCIAQQPLNAYWLDLYKKCRYRCISLMERSIYQSFQSTCNICWKIERNFE